MEDAIRRFANFDLIYRYSLAVISPAPSSHSRLWAMLMDSNSQMTLLFTLFIGFPVSDTAVIAFIRETKRIRLL